MTPDDAVVAATISRLVDAHGPLKSICPSEAARELAAREADWRALMPEIRRVAASMVADGRLRATQRGAPVDPLHARGAIRLWAVAPPDGLRGCYAPDPVREEEAAHGSLNGRGVDGRPDPSDG